MFIRLFCGCDGCASGCRIGVYSQSLRSFQKQNEDNDKRQQILRSINVNVSSSEAETKYNELIKEAFLVNENGEKVEGDAFATDVVKAAAEHQYRFSSRM